MNLLLLSSQKSSQHLRVSNDFLHINFVYFRHIVLFISLTLFDVGRREENVGHQKPKQHPIYCSHCSDWFILQLEKFRSEKVGMVSTFCEANYSLQIRREFSKLHFCAYFSRIRSEKFAWHEFFRLV